MFGDELVYEISLDNLIYVDEIFFGLDDLLNLLIIVYLRVIDEYGNVVFCIVEVNLVDDIVLQIVCLEDCDIFVDEMFCVGIIFDFMVEMIVDNCVLIDIVFQVLVLGLLFGILDGDMLMVVLIVVDVNGNIDICGVKLMLCDVILLVFINCFVFDVVLISLLGECSNFVNFSLLLVEDNCGLGVEVIQIDDMGFISGDVFLVGIIILEFMVIDEVGNFLVCICKVIINDIEFFILINGDGCFVDQVVDVSLGECGVYVSNIVLCFQDNCMDNLIIVYCLLDE